MRKRIALIMTMVMAATSIPFAEIPVYATEQFTSGETEEQVENDNLENLLADNNLDRFDDGASEIFEGDSEATDRDQIKDLESGDEESASFDSFEELPVAGSGDVIAEGTCGDNVRWTLDTDGLLSISGTGKMYDYNRAPWITEKGYIHRIVIQDGVTSIGMSAFRECSSFTSIVIPEGVRSIGEYAFFGCSSLTSIVIPKGVTSIGDCVFYDCYHLTSAVIPEGVKSIGESAFFGCSSLTSIVIPEGVKSIGEYAFMDCDRLTSVVIPEGVRSIGAYAFAYCSRLTSVVIPEGVKSIGYGAFSRYYNFIIYGSSGSCAETYAKKNYIPFVAINQSDNKPSTPNKPSGELPSQMKEKMDKKAVSFANIFSQKAKSASGTTTKISKQQLENFRKQIKVTGYKGTLPDEVIEAFGTAILEALNDSNIDEYETDNKKLTEQIYKQIKGGLKSNSKKITLGKGSKKTTYTVSYAIFALSHKGYGVQASFADVKWKDNNNKSFSAHITATSSKGKMEKALSAYCATLAQLHKGLWKDFLVKYVTDGWKLADLNTIKKLDDKTVSKFFDHSEKLILAISGDEKAKKAFINDAEGTLKTKLSKMSKSKFRDFIKQNVPSGDRLVKAADQYKKAKDKYNDYIKKYVKWEETKKDSDLTKCEKAYQESQKMLKSLDNILGSIS